MLTSSHLILIIILAMRNIIDDYLGPRTEEENKWCGDGGGGLELSVKLSNPPENPKPKSGKCRFGIFTDLLFLAWS